MIQVEVVGFDATGRALKAVASVRAGAVVADVFPVLDAPLRAVWQRASGFAVWGQQVAATATLSMGDRLELLLPLKADPKEARRLRVEGVRRANAEQGRFDRWTRSR